MSPTLAQQTEAVISRHLQSIMSKNVDEVLKDYTDESFLLTQNGPVRGLAQLRSFFEAFIAGLTPEVMGNLQITRLDYEGEAAYIVFSAPPLASLGTDTFIVRNDKIVIQSFTVLG